MYCSLAHSRLHSTLHSSFCDKCTFQICMRPLRCTDKNQWDTPLLTSLKCLVATWRNSGSNNSAKWIVYNCFAFIVRLSLTLSICQYFLQFSQPLRQSNCQQQHLTLMWVVSVLVPSLLLTCTDLLLSGWLIVGTNLSEWVQIFRKICSGGKQILRRSKLNVTNPVHVCNNVFHQAKSAV